MAHGPDEDAAVAFAAGGAVLRLTLMGRPFPESEHAWDRDALRARIEAASHPFSGAFDAMTSSRELAMLREQLAGLASRVGEAIEHGFAFRDGYLRLVFALQRGGALTVHVEVHPDPANETVLRFDVEADQSYLPIWLEALGHALERFPVQV